MITEEQIQKELNDLQIGFKRSLKRKQKNDACAKLDDVLASIEKIIQSQETEQPTNIKEINDILGQTEASFIKAIRNRRAIGDNFNDQRENSQKKESGTFTYAGIFRNNNFATRNKVTQIGFNRKEELEPVISMIEDIITLLGSLKSTTERMKLKQINRKNYVTTINKLIAFLDTLYQLIGRQEKDNALLSLIRSLKASLTTP